MEERGCYEECGTESCSGYHRSTAEFQCVEGEVVGGDEGVVCAEGFSGDGASPGGLVVSPFLSPTLGVCEDSFGLWKIGLTDCVVQKFVENLGKGRSDTDDERDQYFGLSLRELVHHFKWQILVLFKCLLLQPKV